MTAATDTSTGPATPDQVTLRQEAPWPAELAELVARVQYRPGWRCWLEDCDRGQGSKGLTLVIRTMGYDSYHPDRGETYGVLHYMIVPAASYNRQSWLRWLFEQFLLVEQHEAMEFFAIRHAPPGGVTLADGSKADHYDERPFAPNHGPGFDPYTIREETTDEARRTSFRGTLNPPTIGVAEQVQAGVDYATSRYGDGHADA